MSIYNKFLQNEILLKKEFSFELLCRQLVFLAKYAKELRLPEENVLSRKALVIRNSIIKNGYIDSRLVNTLLFTQARSVIDAYLEKVGNV